MNEFHAYKNKLENEMTLQHTYSMETYFEIMKILKKHNITDMDMVMKVVFDYAFKCGIKRALDLTDRRNE